MFTVLADLLGSPGWPPGLYEAGERWTNEVGATASALAGLACWICLAAAMIDYVIELRAAAAVALTVIGAPLGVAAAGLSTGKVLGIVSVVLAGLVTLATMIITQYKDLNQRLTNNDGFADGWPRVDRAGMSDARITDADRTTDWKLDY